MQSKAAEIFKGMFMDDMEDSDCELTSLELSTHREEIEKVSSSPATPQKRESKGKRALQLRRAVEDLMEARRYQRMHEDFYQC